MYLHCWTISRLPETAFAEEVGRAQFNLATPTYATVAYSKRITVHGSPAWFITNPI